MTTVTDHKPNTFISYSKSGMENGSCYRVTGRKKEKFAIYILGDFHGFTNELPEDYVFCLPRKEAKKVLPSCFN